MMKGYSEYKNSSAEWIGEIPSHWTICRMKNLAKIKNGKDQKEVLIEEGGYPVLGTGGEFGRASHYLHKGPSVLLGRKGTIDKPQLIKEAFWTVDTLFYTEIKENVLPDYLFHLVNQIPFSRLQESSAVPSMTQEKLNNVPLCKPPLEEQEKICSFIDNQTSLIDTIISKKEKLIELLKEKRQAVINEAVTKGLDPTVKMKDSGIEWLGEIPEGWEVVKLSRFGYFSKGKGITKDKIVEEGYACIRCGELYTTYDRIFEDAKSFINQETTTESVLGKKGDVLMAGDGETYIEIGKAVLYNGNSPIYVGGGINVFTPDDKKVSFEFLSYTLNSSFSIDQKSIDGRGDIIVHIYAKQLKEHLVVLPPISTQIEIENYLNRLEQKHQQSKRILLEQIEKLKEYRQSLISEVVTGKIDVREWEPKNIVA